MLWCNCDPNNKTYDLSAPSHYYIFILLLIIVLLLIIIVMNVEGASSPRALKVVVSMPFECRWDREMGLTVVEVPWTQSGSGCQAKGKFGVPVRATA